MPSEEMESKSSAVLMVFALFVPFAGCAVDVEVVFSCPELKVSIFNFLSMFEGFEYCIGSR